MALQDKSVFSKTCRHGPPLPVDKNGPQRVYMLSRIEEEVNPLARFVANIKQQGIQLYECKGGSLPSEALMHDRAAVVPIAVVSPRSEEEVVMVLRVLKALRLYERYPVCIRSGGHGYFNGASCTGIMINLALMERKTISDNVLVLEPGCILGQIIATLAAHGKAVPHGDCFGVGAGGHFLTAGWDIALARRYGLGCQAVVGGRVALWDGTVVEVDEQHHPDLLFAMRGGAAAGVGVVTEIRLRLREQPQFVACRFRDLSGAELKTCIAHRTFARAAMLPNDVSVSFRFHFDPSQMDPVCSFNIISLLSIPETIECLDACLGSDVTALMADVLDWHEKSLLELRMVPASEALAANPQSLTELKPADLHERPGDYWKPTVSQREMASSYFTSISQWVVPECDEMFGALYEAFRDVCTLPARKRMYALIVMGGGKMTETQDKCSMPLGTALARFEMHWDDAEDEAWSRNFTDRISSIMESQKDRGPCRPYRGNIWLDEQGRDPRLDEILQAHDRRPAQGISVRDGKDDYSVLQD